MNSPDHFKEILKRKFSDFEELPPENDWEVFKTKFDLKKSRIQLYRRISVLSAIAVIVIIATIVILVRNDQHKYNPERIQPKEVHQQKVLNSKPENNKQPASQTSLNFTSRKAQNSKPQSPKVISDVWIQQNNKAGKSYSDTAIKISGMVVKKESQEKPHIQTQADKPPVNSKTVEVLQNNLNRTEPVFQNTGKTDTLSAHAMNKEPVKAEANNPISSGDKIEPEVVNVITPNGDGINDKLVIKNLDLIGPCTLSLFDSWGEKIYSSSNYQNNWDATYKGKPVTEGTYYYVLET